MRYLMGKLPVVLVAFGLLGILSHNANAAVQITGTVGTSGKFLITGVPVPGPAPAVIKLVFGNLTSGTNLELCAGSSAEFSSGTCAITLSSSGGPGFNFLTIVESCPVERQGSVRKASRRNRSLKILVNGRLTWIIDLLTNSEAGKPSNRVSAPWLKLVYPTLQIS